MVSENVILTATHWTQMHCLWLMQ